MNEQNLRIPQPPVWATASDLGVFEAGKTVRVTVRAFAGSGAVRFDLAAGEGVILSSDGEAEVTLPATMDGENFRFSVKATAEEGGMESIRSFQMRVSPATAPQTEAPWEPVPPPEPAPEPTPAPEPAPVELAAVEPEEPTPVEIVYDPEPQASETVAEPEIVVEELVVPTPEPEPEPVVLLEEVSPPPAVQPAPPTPVARDEIWSTPAGNIGIYASGERVSITFEAKGARMFHLIRGRLPQGTMLTKSTGRLSGTLRAQSSNTTFQFTLRADTGQGFSDRTFKLTVKAAW